MDGPDYKRHYERQKLLIEGALKALQAADTTTAIAHANLVLEENTDAEDWNYGNILHDANQILGLAALQEGRLDDAKQHLAAAGSTPGSPQLNSFGPKMALAQALLEQNESECVIEYLNLVARFWAEIPEKYLKLIEEKMPEQLEEFIAAGCRNREQIDGWISQIQAGEQPRLNMSDNLFYGI